MWSFNPGTINLCVINIPVMFVPSMNIIELKKELLNDYHSLYSSTTVDRLTDVYHDERIRAKIKKEDIYPRFYEIKTKSKNHWVFYFSKGTTCLKFHAPEDSMNMSFTYYNSPHGIQVFIVDPLERCYIFNAHLFHRYNERMNLNIPNSLDVVKHYIERNYSVIYKKLTQVNGSCKFYGMVRDGFVMGIYFKEYDLYENKTFISHTTANLILSDFEKDFHDIIPQLIKNLDSKKDQIQLIELASILKILNENGS